jgi:hypothetical protein
MAMTGAPAETSAQAARLSTIDMYWKRGVVIVKVSKPVAGRAIVDTGGNTELRKEHPRDFETYYHGLPIDMAIGPDYLARHRVLLADTESGRPLRVPLDITTKDAFTLAFVTCTIGSQPYRFLLDTAALAWSTHDNAHATPLGVTFVGRAAFAALRRQEHNRPGRLWQIMNESGRFVSEPSLIVATLRCGSAGTSSAIVVERSDDTTYHLLKKTFGFTVDGDVGLGGLPGRGWIVDFPDRLLTVEH